MKILIIFAFFSMFLGCKARRFNAQQGIILGLFIGTIVASQIFNIVFRHIGVD